MIRCVTCRDDITVLLTADVATVHEDAPFCSAKCRDEWLDRHERRVSAEWWRPAVSGWIAAGLCWVLLYYAIYAAPMPITTPAALLGVLIGASVGGAVFWKGLRPSRPASIADMLDF